MSNRSFGDAPCSLPHKGLLRMQFKQQQQQTCYIIMFNPVFPKRILTCDMTTISLLPSLFPTMSINTLLSHWKSLENPALQQGWQTNADRPIRRNHSTTWTEVDPIPVSLTPLWPTYINLQHSKARQEQECYGATVKNIWFLNSHDTRYFI